MGETFSDGTKLRGEVIAFQEIFKEVDLGKSMRIRTEGGRLDGTTPYHCSGHGHGDISVPHNDPNK
jgi:hypothetical protein